MKKAGILVLLLPALLSCSRKHEILPAAAGQVTREDSVLEADMVPVQLRHYTFTVPGYRNDKFICEARRYPDETSAQAAAVKSIAQRPAEELKKAGVWFARAGRSLWLKSGVHLTWCMSAGESGADVGAALGQVREAFLRAYEAAS